MITQARELARARLAFDLPQRWRHTEATAREAERIAPAYGHDATILLVASWLLDIGYAPELRQTGFHPLDSAAYLTADGWLPRIVDLVAHHSGAAAEAQLRGLRDSYAPYNDEATPTRDALWYCDLTTTPDGADHLADAEAEFTTQSARHQISTARAEFAAVIDRTRRKLKAARL